MECRLCGYEFTEEEAKKSCQENQGCSKCTCNLLICPNCGYSNDPVYEKDFEFIEKIKEKLKKLGG
jgi:rubredoxin